MRWLSFRDALVVTPLVVVACASARVGQPDVLTIDVAPHTVPCQGEGIRTCMVVRLGRDTTWTYFYDPIEGFQHEAGYRYRLEVERRVVERPPADGSRIRYRLVRVIAKRTDPAKRADQAH